MPSPVLWGDEATVRDRFREGIADLKCTLHDYRFHYPFPPEAVVEFYRTNYGPVSRAFASLDSDGQERLRHELVALWSAHNKSVGAVTRVDAEYLQVIATRDRSRRAVSQTGTNKIGESMSRRTELLADRIEEGADRLAAFVEGLSEAEWRMPVSSSDARSIGIIVHHVASAYPVEIDLARAIASGKAVTDVTWDVVDEINATHARQNAGVTKAAALELLRSNSRQAAVTVRALTDYELDRAAPFSLSFGAPVTAQFVIEDHAIRHSWHHLARIRTAVSR
jgi:hypothetical protein